MAYKVFSNGNALNASELNTYLMNQSVMVFASTTARDAALTAPIEGQLVWLEDSNKYVHYTGSAWSDLITPASSGNAIINGAFEINQRGFTSSTSGGYGFDRWTSYQSGGTVTWSAQTFSTGTAPVAGYEAKNFSRVVTSGQSASGDAALFIQNLEDVRTFAGQTVTLSFWAKAGSGTPKIGVELYQSFGSGGSPSSEVSTPAGTITLSTSWARYSVTVAIPSIAGKTIGTNANSSILAVDLWVSAGSTFNSRASSIGIQNNTFDIWGVQLESGSTATAFKRNASNIQGELAACQRYFYDPLWNSTAANRAICNANAYSTTAAFGLLTFPTSMRVAPSINSTASSFALGYSGGATLTSMTIETSQPDSILLLLQVSSGLTTNASYHLYRPGTSATLQFSAEL